MFRRRPRPPAERGPTQRPQQGTGQGTGNGPGQGSSPPSGRAVGAEPADDLDAGPYKATGDDARGQSARARRGAQGLALPEGSQEFEAPRGVRILPARDLGRRRDRRGHGPRGPLMPPGLPAALTRSDRFDEYTRAALRRLQGRWERRIARLEVAVEPVPASDVPPWEGGVPLARSFPAADGLPDRIILYRRPIEARAMDTRDLGLLILDVIVEQLGHLWRMPPEEVDPGFGDPAAWR